MYSKPSRASGTGFSLSRLLSPLLLNLMEARRLKETWSNGGWLMRPTQCVWVCTLVQHNHIWYMGLKQGIYMQVCVRTSVWVCVAHWQMAGETNQDHIHSLTFLLCLSCSPLSLYFNHISAHIYTIHTQCLCHVCLNDYGCRKPSDRKGTNKYSPGG